MSLHIINNLTAWIMEFLTMHLNGDFSDGTLTEFQESWWIGVVGLIASIPFIIYFYKHYIRNTDWRVPYFRESA